MADPSWLEGLRALCTERGALLVFDEVQTGFGRTGRLFCADEPGARPDLITCAKGIAGGFPAGCVFVREDLGDRMRIGEQGTTFGGGPLASAAMAAVARILVEEDLPANAARVGEALTRALEAVPGVAQVVGRGLMLGIDLDRPAKPVVKQLLGEGFIVGGSGLSRQIRLLPPLTLTVGEAETFPPVLARVLAEDAS
ncbi:MAG: aminotransferase class III-fold pyridoxal phosphate-dependent enzyme [Planctomycetota bacterium]